MDKHNNFKLRDKVLELTKAQKTDGGNAFGAAERMMLLELACAYNPKLEGCHPSGKYIASKTGYELRTFNNAIVKAKDIIGLRWIHLNKKNGTLPHSKTANNSYDFRHIDPRAQLAWRGNGKVWVFGDYGNVRDEFNGVGLSYKPFETPKAITEINVPGGGIPLEFNKWFSRGLMNGSAELAAAMDSHRKVVGLSDAEAMANVRILSGCDLDDANKIGLIAWATHHSYPVLDPTKWITKDSGNDDADATALKDAMA